MKSFSSVVDIHAGYRCDFVILSLVRSQPFEDIKNPDHVWADRGWVFENLGFITDQHQIGPVRAVVRPGVTYHLRAPYI